MFSIERLPYATRECNLHPRVVRVAPSRHQCTNSIPSVVADEYAGQTDKDWSKGREPCPLCGIPVGRGGSTQSTV